MLEQCCVDGCLSVKEDLHYFKLPVSRTLRKRWLEAMKCSLKLSDDAVVCSRHFLADQYVFVRGKRRLKPKVVPCLFENRDEKAESNENITETNSISCDTNGADIRLDEDKTDKEVSIETDDKTSNIPEGSSRNSPQKVKEKTPDLEFSPNKDIEDILTNYHIKQTRSLAEITAEREPAEGETKESGREESGRDRESGREESERESEPTTPKYVEISVGGKGHDQTNQDCLMLLENVQVEIDPTLFPELDHDHDHDDDNRDHDQSIEKVDLDEDSGSDCIDLGEKKEAPISLLSSSDEDDVIIQEPKIDTIEVSDATDEDDIPLLKLAKIRKKAKKRLKKNPKRTAINKIMLNKYKCEHCKYTARDAADYKQHMSTHTHVLHICDVCSYTTSSWLLMHRHRDKHSRETKNSKRRNKEKKYKCPLCSYRAKHNMSLVYHMSTHNRKSAFECDKCGFLANVREQVLEHLRSCESQFACRHCSFSTGTKHSLRRHLKRLHHDDNTDDGDYVPPNWT